MCNNPKKSNKLCKNVKKLCAYCLYQFVVVILDNPMLFGSYFAGSSKRPIMLLKLPVDEVVHGGGAAGDVSSDVADYLADPEALIVAHMAQDAVVD